ncbi:2-keto-4-pentenoate hydratase/2-oxohepta-3-ene-1,7-dioic acid hydratase in catechol pathway [Microterricola gilva]|uniref:2-keto-4-pentenoate hydratase/2-oxohepta-3-ene-1,7-dioic acid hydratase in catechol pathway n=1 Tax=Microterricola gilva TaxID=393267 RepID=A0A4Q8AHD1_9MICO|nr:fumarylacetoacetate hydrolase family protein [Microterricola gilva]RZU63724.1 2-keto-4-pentenoate hydratase/2-oxohepta-3-ene-1,7-dioic acid hydratase in catechol pathway [Microterricola gilva]
MQFRRLGPLGAEIPVVAIDGTVYDLRPLTADIDGAFLENDPVGTVQRALAELPVLDDADSLRVGAPVARPGAIYCIGMNYAAHALEGGSLPPERIVMFMKPPHTVAGPDDDFVAPSGMPKLDWEVELAVVIGKRAWQLDDAADPMDHVAGYTLANDLSERLWQLEISGGQWSKGKSGPGFLPLGPDLVPAAEIDPGNLRLQSRVNGEHRQDSRTSDLIFDVATIIRDLSQFTVLEPGDVVLTGTPEGVALSGRFPYLAPGDVMELEIENLGLQRQRVLSAE